MAAYSGAAKVAVKVPWWADKTAKTTAGCSASHVAEHSVNSSAARRVPQTAVPTETRKAAPKDPSWAASMVALSGDLMAGTKELESAVRKEYTTAAYLGAMKVQCLEHHWAENLAPNSAAETANAMAVQKESLLVDKSGSQPAVLMAGCWATHWADSTAQMLVVQTDRWMADKKAALRVAE